MSEKIASEVFLENFKNVYPEGEIEIIEWNGYTGRLRYKCGICGEEHQVSNARYVLERPNFCLKESVPKKYWTPERYKERLKAMFHEDVKLIDFTSLSNEVKYYCPRCHKEKSCRPARILITRKSLCDECYGVERNIVKKRIDELFANSTDYELITWRSVNKKMTIKCNKCGAVFERWPKDVLDSFDNCPNCNSGAIKQRLPIEDMQKRIDKEFGEGQYEIIYYSGQLKKDNKIKCLNCGLIFETQMSVFPQSRGCPKCKRYKSKGEQLVQRYLEENNIKFETQKRFPDCNGNLSSFDFCAYDQNGKMHLIEVNGRQHYFQTGRFGDLTEIQYRDELKSTYCKEHNIPLIVIPYSRLTDYGVDKFLSFLKGSTTIPNGSRE